MMEAQAKSAGMTIVETHAHLDMKEFDGDRDEVVKRAVAAGVNRIITVGTDVASSRKAITLSEKYPQVYAAVGIHPHDAARAGKSDIARLDELAKCPKVVALGEMGLDFYRDYSPREAQFQTLKGQLELAIETKLPVIIHARKSSGKMIEMLSDWVKRRGDIPGKPPGVIHCFSDDIQTAKRYLSLGFYVAFGGYISYPSSSATTVIKDMPRDRLLVETDCPFLPPQKYRGQRNEPVYLLLTLMVIAEALRVSPGEVARQTTENAHRLFKF